MLLKSKSRQLYYEKYFTFPITIALDKRTVPLHVTKHKKAHEYYLISQVFATSYFLLERKQYGKKSVMEKPFIFRNALEHIKQYSLECQVARICTDTLVNGVGNVKKRIFERRTLLMLCP